MQEELCPKCSTPMIRRKEPLKIDGFYVGRYDAMSCPICKYYYFTELGYDSALNDARQMGLVGPALPEVTFVLSLKDIDVGIAQIAPPLTKVIGILQRKGPTEGTADNFASLPKIGFQLREYVTVETKVRD